MLSPALTSLLTASAALALGAADRTPGLERASVQPESIRDVKTITVASTVDQLVKAYRAGPVSDRITLRVVGADKKERRAQVLFWADRGTGTAGDLANPKPLPGPSDPAAVTQTRPPQIRLDLGQLQVHAHGKNPVIPAAEPPTAETPAIEPGGTLTAVNRFERTTVYTAPIKGACHEILADLNTHFQAIPFPQLALAMAASDHTGSGETGLMADAMPMTPGITLDSAEPIVEGGRAVVVMKGRHTGGRAGGTVSVSVERATGRLRKFTADFDGATGNAVSKIELVCAPSDQGDAAKWGIALEGRQVVKSPAELAPRRPGLIAGDSVKNASLMSEDLAPLSPDTIIPKAGGRVLLVCFRGEGDAPPSEADLRATASASARAVKLAAAESPAVTVAVRGVALLGLSEIDPVRLSALAARWRALAAEAGLADTGLLFTASRVLVAEDRGNPADTFAVAVNADLTVRTVSITDRRGTAPDGTPADAASLDSMAAEIAGKPK